MPGPIFTLDHRLRRRSIFSARSSGLGSYDDVLAVSETVGIGGFKVRVLSVEGLIAAKKAADRLQDKTICSNSKP